MHKSDQPERRKLALIRAATTSAAASYTIGGIRKPETRPKPSLPKMPWDDVEAEEE